MHEKEKLLIIPSNFKKIKKINNNLLSNIKVTTFNEIKEELYFKYNEEAIHFIMKKCSVNYELARIYIENMYFTTNVSRETLVSFCLTYAKKSTIF